MKPSNFYSSGGIVEARGKVCDTTNSISIWTVFHYKDQKSTSMYMYEDKVLNPGTLL
ncbi:MAG TPA: hypothetical protein PK581_09160 [Caldisericia bacterium]|nr:hypothetical protein [Caldisericia bacterium]